MDEDQQVIAEIARHLVRTIAPNELPMFRANSAAYFAAPEVALKPLRPREEMLGFGLGDAVGFLTPVAMAAVSAAVTFVTSEIKKAASAESASVISGWVRIIFRKVMPTPAADSLPALAQLSREQLKALYQVTLEKARGYVADGEARRLADELVASIVTV